MKFKVLLALYFILLSFNGIGQTAKSKFGMVATTEKNATEIGVQILKEGGNAVDAAIAVGFALAVTYPQAGNIGGGGFMVIRDANNQIHTLDFREKAPAAASRNMYLDKNGNIIENSSTRGYLASGVPGTVHGFYTAHQKFGKLDWKSLVEPAVALAQNGFVIEPNLERSLQSNRDKLSAFEETNRIFLNNKTGISVGNALIQTDLANSLNLVMSKGIAGFYEGETANKIAAEMGKNGGLISVSDLKDYSSVWREPVHFTYRGYDIFSMPPPSSGGVAIAEILNSLEKMEVSGFRPNEPDLIHRWVEIEKRVYADRAEHLGDNDFYNVPLPQLLDKTRGHNIFSSMNPFVATNSKLISAAKFTMLESPETTHFSVVDSFGLAVSCTYTLNGSYGSGVVIKGTGILMNNEMDDFSIKPGTPNMYGLLGGEANAIEPGKRMLSSMTPTIITKNDSVCLILGSPGGSTIITTVAQVISNIIDHKLPLYEAVDMARFHHQWLPDVIKIESSLYGTVKEEMGLKKHRLLKVNSIGDVNAILWNRTEKTWEGCNDPRRYGLSKGL